MPNIRYIYPWYEFKNYWFKITVTSTRSQWVKHFLWDWFFFSLRLAQIAVLIVIDGFWLFQPIKIFLNCKCVTYLLMFSLQKTTVISGGLPDAAEINGRAKQEEEAVAAFSHLTEVSGSRLLEGQLELFSRNIDINRNSLFHWENAVYWIFPRKREYLLSFSKQREWIPAYILCFPLWLRHRLMLMAHVALVTIVGTTILVPYF